MGTIGSKRNRIRIEQETLTDDGQGGHVRTWTVRAVVDAHERPLSGREALQAQQVQAVLSSVWEIWYRSDISVKDRIVVGSRTLQIESVIDPTDRRQELHLWCSEVQQ